MANYLSKIYSKINMKGWVKIEEYLNMTREEEVRYMSEDINGKTSYDDGIIAMFSALQAIKEESNK